jgi:alkylation response protein AidB-like acyl-CoA dehydrogenase
MGAFGPGLLLEPYLAGAVVAPALIRRVASADFQEEWLPNIATGETIVALADADARDAPVTEIGGNLSGCKAVVAHGGCADLLLVSARCADGVTGLFAVTPGADGVALHDYPTLDGQRAADIVLDNAPATRLDAGGAADAIDAALDIGLAALCSEAVGIMQVTVAATTEYLKTRQQFGQPIGRFQALQHRMADMLLHLEQARSMSYLAAMHCADDDAGSRRRTLSAAKVTIGQACRFIAQNAVQLHGGMGMTDELILSHWFKRLTAIEMSFGDTDFHLQRFAANLSREARAA